MNDKFVEHPMELCPGVRTAVYPFRQYCHEISYGFRHQFAEQTDFDPAQFFTGHFHIQISYVCDGERLSRNSLKTYRNYIIRIL